MKIGFVIPNNDSAREFYLYIHFIGYSFTLQIILHEKII